MESQDGPRPSVNKAGRFAVKFYGDTNPPEITVQQDVGHANPIFARSSESIDVQTTTSDRMNNNNLTTMAGTNTITSTSSLYLYEDDMKKMPRVPEFLHTMMQAANCMTYPGQREVQAAKEQKQGAKLGTLFGVYFPCIQNVLGPLMFIRLAWVVGCAGVFEGFFIVFLSCMATFLTSISLSAIATNGMVQSGGSYYMLSRNLGPEIGGAIGICFYLANTIVATLFLLGLVEILMTYCVPQMRMFGTPADPWSDYRLYGTACLVLTTLIVAVGVKIVAFFAPISLVLCLLAVASVFIGGLVAHGDNKNVWVCMMGERLMSLPSHEVLSNLTMSEWCSKNTTGDIWRRYCKDLNDTSVCDDYFTNNEVRIMAAMPGFSSGLINVNARNKYMEQGEVSPGVKGDLNRGEIPSDTSTGFVVLTSIFFTTVTGILTGANMSGDLRDAQKSLPIGTILAQLTCTTIYLLYVLLFGGTVEGVVLRDKFGSSLGGALVAALLCWPHRWVVLIGGLASSFGAGIQSLVCAERLLQAIAKDDVIPILSVFKVEARNGEPIRALLVTFAISEVFMLIANLDLIAPIIAIFFLMCYIFVNVSCALQTFLKAPNWRPRFKYYHWSISVLGVMVNFTLCIIAGWYYALAAFGISAIIYFYIQFKGGEKEWGDGISGLKMSTAQQSLLKLENYTHTKNWRPQLLVFTKFMPNAENPLEHDRFFSIAAQLKAGKGLSIVATVIPGDFSERAEEVDQVQVILKKTMEDEKIKGFTKVLITENVCEGLKMFIQTVGLGGLRHNTVMMNWPTSWRNTEGDTWKTFINTARAVDREGLALLVPRGIENFPNRKARLVGTIDVWWIVHDGGMLILLAFLLQQHKVWKGCKIRIYTVATMTDNSIQMKKDLEKFLYQIRIPAEVHVEEMYETAITAYTVEKTLDMEGRTNLRNDLFKSTLLQVPEEEAPARLRRVSAPLQFFQKPAEAPNTLQEAKSPEEVLRYSRRMSVINMAGNQPIANYRRLAARHSISLIRSESTGIEDLPIATSYDNPAMEDKAGEEEDDSVHFTFTTATSAAMLSDITTSSDEEVDVNVTDSQGRLLRMHTAVQLNQAIKTNSSDAQLVIVNCPEPPANPVGQENYIHYLDVLTDGLTRVLMVRGSGKEVVTIYT